MTDSRDQPDPGRGAPAAAPSPDRVSGLVLAGGRARRMGGEDKGLVEVGGKAMVQWVCDALRPQCASLSINANRNQARYAALTGLAVIGDDVAGFAGPLAGMAAGLAACATPWMVCAPCDSPLLVPDLVARLCRSAAEAEAPLAVAHDGERMQPVFVLLSRTLLPSMQRFLAEGGRKIDAWYAAHATALAPFPQADDMFLNVNTPEQRDMLDARLRAGAAR